LNTPRLPANPDVVISEPETMLQAFDELLKQPAITVTRASAARSSRIALWLMGGGLISAAIYGAASGFFQGGTAILLPMLKAPIIVAFSLLLCLPSLYIIGSLLGARLTAQRFRLAVAGFIGMIGLLMIGLMPIVWLFSVSSRSLAFIATLHVILWVVCVAFAARFLGLALKDSGASATPVLWVVLFVLVSLQVATFLRPVLWFQPGAPLFQKEKLFFLEHFGRVVDPPAVAPAPGRRQ
jgi:hypothetical protein